MKTPFRLQATEYDCVPTTFVNALAYLFKRSEIPPLVVHRIYMYTLDGVGPRQQHGHGTTGLGVQLLGSWLEEVSTEKFGVATEYVAEEEVNLGPNNRIARCTNEGGVVLLRVAGQGRLWHYVLALRCERRRILCFDPYPKRSVEGRFEFHREPIRLQPRGKQVANLSLHYDWASREANERYCLGRTAEREALLMWRTT